jgi:hypothetical protein
MNVLSKCAMAAVFVLPTVVSAADLRVVGSNADEEVSVDVDTIKVVEGSHTEVVVFTAYRELHESPGLPKFNSTIARMLFRCINATGSIAALAFLNDDKLIKRFDYDVTWRSVDPDTDIGQVWKYICTRQWEDERK